MRDDWFTDTEGQETNKKNIFNKENAAKCGMFMLCCLPLGFMKLHSLGATPFVYNNGYVDDNNVPYKLKDEDDPNDYTKLRFEHYKATFACVSFVTFGVLAGVFGWGFSQEGEFWNGLNDTFHRIAAGLLLLGGAAVVGALAAGAHWGIQKVLDKREGSGLVSTSVIPTAQGRRGFYTSSESTTLIDRRGREVKYSPAYLCTPASPGKTFGWITFMAAGGTAIAMFAAPEAFNTIAETDIAHFFAVFTAALSASSVAASLFTAGHKLRAMGMNQFGCFGKCRETIAPEYKANKESKYFTINDAHDHRDIDDHDDTVRTGVSASTHFTLVGMSKIDATDKKSRLMPAFFWLTMDTDYSVVFSEYSQ